MKGCVNAFSQLFVLSHRDPICVDELAQVMFSIPDNRLPWVQEYLVSVELKRRKSDFRGACEDSLKLAAYFEEFKDTEQALKHLQQALHHAQESLDRALEGEAHEALALFYERRGSTAEALAHHETRYKLSEVTADPATKHSACQHLGRVYQQQGEAFQAIGDLSEARAHFEKAVTVAKTINDSAAEAKAYSSLGNVTVLLGDLQKGLDYQKRFLAVSREARCPTDESHASLKVAELQERAGNWKDAVASLKNALSLAEQTNDLPAICASCRQLGQTYKLMGDSVKSVHYFREGFRVARDIGDPAVVDAARVAIGFALGEHYFATAGGDTGFIGVVVGDLKAQLEWMSTGVL